MNQLPYNSDFERGLIVGILADPTLIPKVSEIISTDDFWSINHRHIWKVINSLPVEEVDSLVVQDKIPEDSKEYYAELIRDSDAILPSLSNILVYAEEIKSKSVLRQGINLGQQIATVGYTPNINAEDAARLWEDLFAKFLQTRVLSQSNQTTEEAFADFVENLGVRIKRDEGTRTGFYSLDLLLHRLEGLTILAAQTSVGKTALAVNIARNVAETKPVLFFSLEQTQEQIFERILSSEAEVSLEDIRTGAFYSEKDSRTRINMAYERLRGPLSRLHVDSRPRVPTSYINSVARQKKVEWGHIGLIVVDYLHIMKLNDKMKVDSLDDAVSELRDLSKEVGSPVLLLSQLSRQPSNEKDESGRRSRRRPELSDLRGSGAIEQVADTVIFLYRDSYFDPNPNADDLVEVLIRKNRQGRIGTVDMAWTPRFVKFADLR